MEGNILQLFEPYSLEYDFSVFLYIGGVGILLFLMIFIGYKLFNKLKYFSYSRKKLIIDFNKPKETAYTITYMIHNYDTPYNQELLERLEQYKYRKDVKPLDEETVKLIEKFLEYVNNA
ncbi:hypothetical protein [Persephonella sp.]|uniref:hypothetical protein n=1 Tax=Persephonella sp. TaxID=2060922 RepID=UPI00260CA890|nr:hypothetical protein [Persephonella sp.]